MTDDQLTPGWKPVRDEIIAAFVVELNSQRHKYQFEVMRGFQFTNGHLPPDTAPGPHGGGHITNLVWGREDSESPRQCESVEYLQDWRNMENDRISSGYPPADLVSEDLRLCFGEMNLINFIMEYGEDPLSRLIIIDFDIVIVHGLQGHPYKTWACKDTYRDVPSAARLSVEALNHGNSNQKSYHHVVPRLSWKSSGSSSIGPDPSQRHSGMSRDGGDEKESRVFWPKDLLPARYPNARVLVYGYDTRVTNYLSGPTNENSIHSHGKDLLSSLAASRKLDSPLILIAHSLGGIVVKEMLASSSSSTEHRLRNVVASTAAVIFLGTPHRGSADLAKLGDRARRMISALRMKTNPATLDALRLRTKDLEIAQESFSAVWNRYDFRVKTFQEGLGLTGVNFGPFGKKVVPDDSSLLGDVRERAETIQANHMEMCRFTGLDDPNYERLCGEITEIYDWLAGLNATAVHRIRKRSLTVSGLATSSHESRAGAMSEREKTCLQSLLFPNMNQRIRNLENPADGTCSWFFEHEHFIHWITGNNQAQSCGLLWVRGKPGSGKSTLLKEAFSRATIMTSSSECHVMSFFFNAKGEGLEHSPTGMLRSIVHQMCSQNSDLLGALLNFAQSRRALCGEDMAPWEEAELRAFFTSVIASHKERIIIFVDAIDECDSNSMREVADFWREITNTAYGAGVQFSVCLSSRHSPAITVNNCPEIIMEDHNYPDIVDFVGRRLDLGMSGTQEDRQAIQQKILGKSGGMFLWVSLVVKDVLRKKDEGRGLKSLLKDLDSVPRELESLFGQLLTTGEFSEMAVRMFQWVLLPAKPLRLYEWHHVLAFIGDTPPSSLSQWRQSGVYTEADEQLEKRITHLSRGLLGLNVRAGDAVEPGDEAMSDRAGAGSLDLNTGETRKPLAHAHLQMMSVCIDYMLIAELDALVEAQENCYHEPTDHDSSQASVAGRSQVLEDYPALLSYATSELFSHARKADVEGVDPTQVIRRLRNGAWNRWKVLQEDIGGQIELLYYAAELGLSSWLQAKNIWEESEAVSAIDQAIANRNGEVLGELLEYFPSAAYVGDAGSRLRVFACVPDAGRLQTYLSQHPSQRHDTISPMVPKKDILESRDEDGRASLHLVVIQQNRAAVTVLVKHGADVSAVDSKLWTPLHLACMNTRPSHRFPHDKSTTNDILGPRSDVIELLLNHHAQIDAVDMTGRTPLAIACRNSALSVRRDTDENLSGVKVHFDRGDSNAVEVLLKHGADANIRSSKGLLPLHEACWTPSDGLPSKVPIVSKLLDYGSPVNAVGNRCGTPLHFACCCTDHQVVEELLRRGANPLQRDHGGRTPLHIATACSTEQVMQTLLSFPGPFVDVADKHGSTPLHVACDPRSIPRQVRDTRLANIRRLLAHRAKAYTTWNEDGDSPVDVARKFDFEGALELLAEESCDAPGRQTIEMQISTQS
ncbi:hypothetical protein LA080_003245 [Diaporthe eres]|nr:hypothetical protein LA080_003245 [Diaporthe eres]